MAPSSPPPSRIALSPPLDPLPPSQILPSPPSSPVPSSHASIPPPPLSSSLSRLNLSTHLSLSSSLTGASPSLLSPSADASPSTRFESRQAFCDSPTAMPLVSPNGSAVDTPNPDGKAPPPSLSKSAWGKLVVLDAGISPEPAPVMGAVSWPALSEARNVKAASEPSKSGPQKPAAKMPVSVSSGENSQVLSLELISFLPFSMSCMGSKWLTYGAWKPQGSSLPRSSGNGPNLLNVRKHKTLTQQGTSSNGMSLTVPNSTDMAVSSTSLKTPDEDRNSRGTRNGTGVNQRGNASSATSNNAVGNRRNFMRDQGRGNHGWHSHGRAYPNGRDTNIPFQQQWNSPRNFPRPFIPYINANPPFVNAVGYPTIPGNMYYVHTPPPDRFVSPTYFAPPTVGVVMQSPEAIALQSALVKQIEYYFSVENLCRDIYLRSNMDIQGFVPVSVIANFNRVRSITNNVFFILEALKTSNVLEVQGDRIRKRDDWMNWLIPSRPNSVGGPSENDQNIFSPRPTGNTEGERFRSGQNSNTTSEHVEADDNIFGASEDLGGKAPPINGMQQNLDYRSSDDNSYDSGVLNSSKEPYVHLKDKSDSQSIKVYNVE